MKKGRISIGRVTMIVMMSIALIQASIEFASGEEQQAIDLTQAVIIAPQDFSGPENKAVSMLIEEVEKRTQVRWMRVNQLPNEGLPFISINRMPIKGGSKAPLARE